LVIRSEVHTKMARKKAKKTIGKSDSVQPHDDTTSTAAITSESQNILPPEVKYALQ